MALGLGYQQLPGLLGGSTRRALACADSLKRLNPGRGTALRGTILSLEGRWPEAEAAFAAALEAAPRDPEVIYQFLDALGSRETRKRLGSPAQKARLAQEARRLLPACQNLARPLGAVCDALLDADLGQEAWTAAQEALPKTDAPSLLHLQLGKVSARSGLHLEEGLSHLNQALAAPLEGGCGGYATVQWRRGQVLQRLGRIREAREAAQAVLALDPKDSRARRLVEDLH
jgi:tetratricopeptide (TPR) repeat protein